MKFDFEELRGVGSWPVNLLQAKRNAERLHELQPHVSTSKSQANNPKPRIICSTTTEVPNLGISIYLL
jgi:hypothetical protein